MSFCSSADFAALELEGATSSPVLAIFEAVTRVGVGAAKKRSQPPMMFPPIFQKRDFYGSDLLDFRIFRTLRSKFWHSGRRTSQKSHTATLTQPSPTSFPVIQRPSTLSAKCCCILPGIYILSLGFSNHYSPHLRRNRTVSVYGLSRTVVPHLL